jgi:capsular exopolysaccharide synthesis family protein
MPVKPRKTRDTLLGLLVGFGVGLCIAWGLSALDTAIHSPDDLEQTLDFPFLGVIARFRIPQEERGRGGELIVQVQPHSPEAEVFRAIRTSIMAARSELPRKALLLTSVTPGEGKTMVAANLAVALAQAGRKVLLVDADMRKPRLGKLFHTYEAGPGLEEFGLGQLKEGASLDGATRPTDTLQTCLEKLARVYDEGPGLAQLLGGDASLDEATHPTAVERLSLIPCPAPAAYPSELLESERLTALIASAKERYDFVLFDSPPLMAVTDAAILASRVDGVVLVIKSDATPRELLRQAMARLADVKATVVGGVLNMVDVRRNHSYHMSAYKY